MPHLPPVYLFHPVAVHFPIALLSLGAAAQLWRLWRGQPSWLKEGVSWLLWLGTAAAWAAMSLGLLAEKTAPHVPPAWEELAEHKEMAFWTVGLFTALSVWRYWLGTKWERYFTAAWLACLVVLWITAYHGGEIVFGFGMGVRQ